MNKVFKNVAILLIGNLFFLMMYFGSQLYGESMCKPKISCVMLSYFAYFSAFLAVAIDFLYRVVLKRERLDFAGVIILTYLFFYIIIVLSSVVGKTNMGKSIEKSRFFCSAILIYEERRNNCFYYRAQKTKNLSDCEFITTDEKYACRTQIKYDTCNAMLGTNENHKEREVCIKEYVN